ncbi:MAG: hypothetical protein M3Q97_07670, partial [Bacteroidota bacterium]|nr:hypothetical protein [Bacteroidota bacterium]
MTLLTVLALFLASGTVQAQRAGLLLQNFMLEEPIYTMEVRGMATEGSIAIGNAVFDIALPEGAFADTVLLSDNEQYATGSYAMTAMRVSPVQLRITLTYSGPPESANILPAGEWALITRVTLHVTDPDKLSGIRWNATGTS